MIDSLIDELNKSADEWNRSNMFELARMCLNATVTILELRNDADLLRAMLSQVQTEKRCYMAENAKLREQSERLFDKTLELATENSKLRELCKLCEREVDNAKLRELAERAWKSAERLCQAFDGPCRGDGVTIYKPCPMGERDEECIYGQLQRDLRELGVEVDG